MAGYSETPLLKKLGIKSGFLLYVKYPPEDYFKWLGTLPEQVTVSSRCTGELDFIHLFCMQEKIIKSELPLLKSHLKKTGMVWISWPKKSAKANTDLTETIIRDTGLSHGLVDIKVCAVNDFWSGLKFVIRVKDR